MAYATTEDLIHGKWDFGSILMLPTATSNTNHMAVFDFQGKTYFIYHNGSLPAGNGYRRSACITELHFKEDGSVEPIQETAAGLGGTVSTICLKGSQELLTHENFINDSRDNSYPYLNVAVGMGNSSYDTDGEWVISAGKADAENEAYVSIQSENKPGLYLTANKDQTVVLSQDIDASKAAAKRQTFHTVTGLGGEGVSFESVAFPGSYLTIKDGVLCLTDGSDSASAAFDVMVKE